MLSFHWLPPSPKEIVGNPFLKCCMLAKYFSEVSFFAILFPKVSFSSTVCVILFSKALSLKGIIPVHPEVPSQSCLYLVINVAEFDTSAQPWRIACWTWLQVILKTPVGTFWKQSPRLQSTSKPWGWGAGCPGACAERCGTCAPHEIVCSLLQVKGPLIQEGVCVQDPFPRAMASPNSASVGMMSALLQTSTRSCIARMLSRMQASCQTSLSSKVLQTCKNAGKKCLDPLPFKDRLGEMHEAPWGPQTWATSSL